MFRSKWRRLCVSVCWCGGICLLVCSCLSVSSGYWEEWHVVFLEVGIQYIHIDVRIPLRDHVCKCFHGFQVDLPCVCLKFLLVCWYCCCVGLWDVVSVDICCVVLWCGVRMCLVLTFV